MKKSLFIGILFLMSYKLFALQLGEVPVDINLSGKDGGKVDGSSWSSSMLTGKVSVLFYVDPDKKDLNSAFSEALKKRNFSLDSYQSIAIVNLAATWIPDIAIESKLKAKQKKYPKAIYVKDKNKILVKKWNLADDESNIVVFGKDAKVLYFKNGKLEDDEITKVLQLIENNL